jgi:rRNA maturation RNase YbeY
LNDTAAASEPQNAHDFRCETSVNDLAGLSDPELEQSLQSFCCRVLAAEQITGRWTCVIVLTTDGHLSQLHAEFLGLDVLTDIMTFPYEEEFSDRGGDIVISADQAREQSKDAGWTLSEELHFLVAHGALHLAGWSDENGTDRTRMLKRQRQLLAEFQVDDSSGSVR